MRRHALLAFDTSGPHIAAVVSDGDVPVAGRFQDMPRGQGEALFPTLEDLLAQAGIGWGDLAGLGVGVGPGNFTGIRISVSAARGLALALNIPALGLSSFALRRDPYGPEANAAELVTLQAPRDQLYAQMFRYGREDGPPRMIDPKAAPDDLRRPGLIVTGDQADRVANALGGTAQTDEMDETDDLPLRLAKVTDWLFRLDGSPPAPAPLYVRAPDAAPARGEPIKVLP